ncbi:acyl-CoA dehydrogenase family protein [Nocardia sp. NPDC048505]|uniref:acyl-CoA dehydrogenase family protein n=1 Tax=unclassified Nocardia TaxID=2637762 RepID=UPI0033DCC3A5
MSPVRSGAAELPPLFEFTDEHHALRELLRRWFEQAGPAAEWGRLCAETGVGELLFGDATGEFAGTAIDIATVAEVSGAALFGGPVLSMAVAGALAEVPSVGALRAGTMTVAVADSVLGRTGVAHPRLHGEAAGATLSGRIEPVWDLGCPDLIVCAVRADGSDDVLAVLRAEATGVELERMTCLDLSRGIGRIDCAEVTPEFVLSGDAARRVTAAMRRRADLVLAAEALGAAQCALDRTVEYARSRVQFGRTIGSFQAVKHRLADLVTQVELTRSAVYGAAWALAAAPERPGTAVDLAVAAAVAAETAVGSARTAVQLHGGIAITWEHWAHRYLRRAHAVAALTGGAAAHRRRLADLLEPRDGRHDR